MLGIRWSTKGRPTKQEKWERRSTITTTIDEKEGEEVKKDKRKREIQGGGEEKVRASVGKGKDSSQILENLGVGVIIGGTVVLGQGRRTRENDQT